MKYLSIFFSILFVWIAVILMAFVVKDPGDMFKLYIALIIFTLTLFIIGFGKGK
jgi:hypothetical protein